MDFAQTGVRSLVKIAAVAIFLAAAPLAWVPLVFRQTSTLVAIDYPFLASLYLLAGLLGIVGITGTPFIRTTALRWPLVLLFLLGFGANHLAESVQRQPLSSHMIGTLLQARHFYGNAIGAYGRQIVRMAAIVLCLAPPLLMCPQRQLSVGSWFAGVPVFAMALTGLIIVNLTGRVEQFPAPIAMPVQLYVGARETLVYSGRRDPVVYPGSPVRRFEKIVLIVDEGARGDYLQINNPAFDNTPFLVSAKPSLANFGLAVSYSNCSDTARAALRSGARDSDFPDPQERILHQPSFWQFAKRAGYRTVHIDAWETRHPMANMQTYDELRYIDERESVPLAPYSEVDDRVAERLIAEFARPGPALIYVEKMGVHAPYGQNLPPASSYEPGSGRLPHKELDAGRAGDIKDYTKAIWWRVDRFFQRVLPAMHTPGTLLIYTSDHGQAMYDGGYDGTACSGANSVKGEGIVPLFVFSTDQAIRSDFQASAARSFNRAAHSDIFPTLLIAMGFDPAAVRPPYVGSLLNVPALRSRRFFVFSPFTEPMTWVAID